MSIAEIVRRLDASVDVLDRPRFRGDPRHRSVADTIRWSYDLLSPQAARLFEELAVFAGPFSGSTAGAVASVETQPRFDALLDELTYASLVTVDTSGPETRYRLLETVRQFALDRLRRRGALEPTYDRFADHVVASVREIVRGATTSWRPGLLRDLVAAFDDLAEALRWCTAHDTEPRRAYALCATLWGIVHQGRADDIADLARRTLARWPDQGSPASAQCVAALATAEYVTGHPERALELVASTLAALRSPGLASVTLRRVEGQARRAVGDTEGSLTAFREGARVAQELGMPSMAMELEIAAAVVSADRGEVHAGVAALGELVERAAASGSVITESWARAAWGWLLLRVDPATALPVIEAGLAEARRIDYPIAVAVDLRSLAYARLLLGDLPGATEAAGRAARRPARAGGALERPPPRRRDGGPGPPLRAPRLGDPRHHRSCPADHHPHGRPARAGAAPGRRCAGDRAPRRHRHRPDRPARSWRRQERPGRREEGRSRAGAGRLDRAARGHLRDRLRRPGGVGAAVEGARGRRPPDRGRRSGGPLPRPRRRRRGGVLDGPRPRRRRPAPVRAAHPELQEEIEEAEHDHDLARAYKSQVELDALIDHLTAALGVGNKTRSAGGTAERARSAVTHRIRAAIRQLEKLNPNLGRHLRHAINTGTYCSYRPEQPTTWRIT